MDYAAIATAIGTEVTGALGDFTVLIGIVVGTVIAWRLVRRIVR